MFNCRFKSVVGFVLILLAGCFGNVNVFAEKRSLSQALQDKMIAKAMASSIKASAGEVSSVYEQMPVPVDINKDGLALSIDQIRNSIFFFNYVSNKYFNVEMDKFLIDNGDYATVDIEWKDVFDKTGKSVHRIPSDEEKADGERIQNIVSRVYIENRSKPVVANGEMKIEVPIHFDRVTFTSSQVGKTFKAGGISATLVRCDNNVASLSVLGDFEKTKPLIIFYDKAGGRIKTGEEMSMNSSTEYKMSCRVSGEIARVDVLWADEIFIGQFDVKATCEPKSFGDDAWNIRAPRYADVRGKCEFKKMDTEALKSECRIVGKRNYASSGYNEPRIALYLPRIDNSCFAKAEMVELELLDLAGEKIEHKCNRGFFEYEEMWQRFDIKKVDDKDKTPLEYSKSVGKLKVHYPAELKFVTLTVDQPRADGLEAIFNDSGVSIGGTVELQRPFLLPEWISVIRGYDSKGRRLKKLVSFSGFDIYRNGIRRRNMGFWGKVSKVEILVVDEWIDVELPFDMPSAKKLPDSQSGLRPADY